MNDAVERIAQAVLYEGYVLWPYRRSALKNQQRWTFGGVHPPAHARAHPDDPAEMQTQCLVEGAAPAIAAEARFLHLVDRGLRDAADRAVDELVADGERHLAWQEATERRIELNVPGSTSIAVPAGQEVEPLGEGRAVRRWRRLDARVDVALETLERALHRLTVRIENTSDWAGGSRPEALERTLVSTHTVLRVRDGAFVSLADPPDHLSAAADACRNVRTWPVLVGDEAARDTLLSSPIILSDFPQVAPESPGDLFDGGEIDQLLILNVLALTDEERAEARASDPRAREILDRCESLSPEQVMALHGRIGTAP